MSVKRKLRLALTSLYGTSLYFSTVVYGATCSGKLCLDSPQKLGLPHQTIGTVAKGLVDTVAFIAGVAAVIFIVLGGIRYASASGNPQNIERAKETLLYAVVGLIISILAPLIIGFAISKGP